jgi:hypothetical protein
VASVVVGLVMVFMPWQVWVHRTIGTWAPSTNLGATVAGATTEQTQRGRFVGSFDLGGVFGPRGPLVTGDEADADRAYRRQGLDRLDAGKLPTTVVARVLRGWELWSPWNAAETRRTRGLPFPGGTFGSLAELAATFALVVAGVRARRCWRTLLPLFALPLLFTLESAALFGDRGLRAWIAPAVAVALGLAASEVLAGIRERRHPSEPVPAAVPL